MKSAASTRRVDSPFGWSSVARRLIATPGGAAGTVILLVVIFLTLVAPLLPYSYDAFVGGRFESPTPSHWLGTDDLGRDVLTRLIYGARPSLLVGVVASLSAAIVGTSVGVLAGFKGGRIDSFAMRCVDIVLAFPSLILILATVTALGPSLTSAMMAIAIVGSANFARVSRAPVLSLVEQEFVQAARVVGARDRRIVLRHLLPNILAPLIVLVSLTSSTAILAEATLSFLGLGIQPPTPSWGRMLFSGRRYMEVDPGLAIYPGVAIMLVVLGFNLLGDALRDVLDPRLGDRA